MNKILIFATALLGCALVRAEESPQFSSPAAKQARATYEKQVNDAVVRYYRNLQVAQKSAMDARNLNEANLIQMELDQVKGRIVASGGGNRQDTVVQATNYDASPRATGIKLRKGQRFTLEPNAEDKWTGGGSKKGVFCDYKGYPDGGNIWMRLMWKIGKAKGEPVVSGKLLTAEEDGELLLFANDGGSDGNEGRIRVNVIISPE